MATQILDNVGSRLWLVAWQQQGITWTNVVLAFIKITLKINDRPITYKYYQGSMS